MLLLFILIVDVDDFLVVVLHEALAGGWGETQRPGNIILVRERKRPWS